MGSDLAKSAYVEALTEKIRMIPLHLAFGFTESTLDRIEFRTPSSLDLFASVESSEKVSWRLEENRSVGARLAPDGGIARELPMSAIDPLELATVDRSVITNSIGISTREALESRPPSEFILWRPPWAAGFNGKLFTLAGTRAAQLPVRSMVLGGPGIGKSIALRQVALDLLSLERVPVFIECGEKWFRDCFAGKTPPPVGRAFLQHYLENTFGDALPPPTLDWLESCGQSGNIVFIFDALDEACPSSDAHKDQFIKSFLRLIQSLTRRKSQPKIVISCRPEGFELSEFHDFFLVRLRRLAEDETSDLVKTLFHTTRTTASGETIRAILSLPDEIRSSALFVFILFIISQRKGGVLPERRVDLISEIVDALLDNWANTKLQERSLIELLGRTKDQVRAAMRTIAIEAIRTIDEDDASPGKIKRAHIFDACFAESVDMEFVFAYLSQVAGLLNSSDGKEFRFVHRTIQEFLVSEELFHKYKSTGEVPEAIKCVTEGMQRWGEPIRMFGELLVRDRRESELLDIVYALTQSNEGTSKNSRHQKVIRLKLACDLLGLQTRHDRWKTSRDRVVADAVVRQCHAALKKRSVTSFAIRRSIAEFMSEYEDWRPGVGVSKKNGLPDIEWIRIEEKASRIGISQEDEALLRNQGVVDSKTQGLSRERPSFTVRLPAFWIARYSVTLRQFLRFVEAPDGYASEVWWRRMTGHQFGPVEIDRWRLLRYSKQGSHPVSGVSWFEAVAFARWLSVKLDQNIGLPSEIEWEVAARGPESYIFPWGNTWHPQRCNWVGLDVGGTLPVGTIPAKLATWEGGPEDMLGNVWEWCTDSAQDAEGQLIPYPSVVRNSQAADLLRADTFRVVRGGSYVNNTSVMRCTFRGRDLASSRLARQGFRLVRHPS